MVIHMQQNGLNIQNLNELNNSWFNIDSSICLMIFLPLECQSLHD